MGKLVKRFWKDEQGLELSEYAVMIALIALVIIVAILALGPVIANQFNKLKDTLETGSAA